MGLLLSKIEQKKGRGRQFWIAFFLTYSMKLIVVGVTIWMFLTLRQDILSIYETCEPFIAHAINISNVTWTNVSNITIVP